MKVYFMRHGESEYNVNSLINQDPRIKVHLTSKGKKQAEEAAKKLKKINFDAIFVSEFVRTQETAVIINRGKDAQTFIDKRINEVAIGLEGKCGKDYGLNSFYDFFNYKSKGTESWPDVLKRLEIFLKELKKEKYENVLVVSHEWIVKYVDEIINGLENKEDRKIPVGNCEFFEFEI